MTSQATTLLINSAAGGARFLISLLIVVLLTPYLIKHVGAEDFGLWNLLLSILGFFELLDLGFGNAVVKYVALYRGMGTTLKRNQALSTIFYVLLSSAAIGAVLIALFSLGFNQWLNIPPDQQNKATVLVWIIALRAIILGIPLGIYRGILFGEQKIFLIQVINVIYQLLYGMGAFLFLRAGYGIVTIAWLTLGTFLLESGTYAFFAHHYWKDIKIRWNLINREEFKEISHFSAAQFLASFTSLIVLRADPLIVNYFFSLSMVGIYAIALKILTYAFILIKQFLQVLTPYIATSKGAGESEKIRHVFIHFPKYAMFPASLITATGSCFAYPLIVLWVGSDFAPAASVLVILLMAFFISIPELVASDILAMTGLHVPMAQYNTIGALINIACSLSLAIPLGLNGIAYGTLIGTTVGMILAIRRACKIYQVPLGNYMLQVYGPALVAGTIQWIVSYGFFSLIPVNNLITLLLIAIPGCLLNSVIYWHFLNSEEKTWIEHKWHRVIGLVK